MIYDTTDYLQKTEAKLRFDALVNKGATFELTEKKKCRTLTQNAAMHLYFSLIADALNDHPSLEGFTYSKILGMGDMKIPYTSQLVKETIWRPLQIALLQKQSTKDLTTDEVTKVADVIEKHFSAKLGINMPFPSIEIFKNDINA